MQDNIYTFKFMTIVCLTCAIVVSTAATGLKSLQEENEKIDVQRNIVRVMGLAEKDEQLDSSTVKSRYDEKIKCIVVNKAGEVIAEDVDPTSIKLEDQEKVIREIAKKKKENAEFTEANKDKTKEIEKREKEVADLEAGLQFPLFVTPKKAPYESYCIPISGKGLWSTLYGYFALEKDAITVRGITFYKHGETPGLGGEIENPTWQNQFVDKQIVDGAELVSIQVKKGGAPEGAKHAVDGISGATLTGNGVQNLLKTDLERYAPYFRKIWEKKGN